VKSAGGNLAAPTASINTIAADLDGWHQQLDGGLGVALLSR